MPSTFFITQRLVKVRWRNPSFTWKNGQKEQRKSGKVQICRKAAWNWKGITSSPMMTSARAKLAMKKLVTDCIRRLVRTMKMTVELPRTAVREVAQ